MKALFTEQAVKELCNQLPSGRFSCDVCNKVYQNQGTLMNHIGEKHSDEIIKKILNSD
jgi:hypothetical protein